MTQPDLFDPTRYPSVPGSARGVDTSIAAAESVKKKAAILREGVLECLRANPEGLTADECAEIMGVHYTNTRPRCTELHQEPFNQTSDSGLRRPTWSGKLAIVWRVKA